MSELKSLKLLSWREVKKAEGVCGIYLISHPYSTMRYVGKSENIGRRWRDHINDLVGKTWTVKTLEIIFHSWTYGLEQYLFSVIEQCDKSELKEKEIYWANKCRQNIGRRSGGGQPYSLRQRDGGRAWSIWIRNRARCLRDQQLALKAIDPGFRLSRHLQSPQPIPLTTTDTTSPPSTTTRSTTAA